MNSAEFTLIVAAAAAVSAGIIFTLLPVLQRYALAHPNARSSHRDPTPQGGGIAVIAATIAVAAGALTIGREPPFDAGSLGMVLMAAVLIALVGAWDDVRTIEVAPRLLLQAFAVGIMISSLPAELRVVPMLSWWVERALLLLACLWFVNLTNFMDGIDWMTVAEFVPLSIGLVIMGWLGALPTPGVLVALALCGGLIGFAPFNRPVARIFLGDVGSLPIGLIFAWLLLLLAGSGHLAAAAIVPLYYLADATLTLLRRIKNREPFWLAHRTHYYQRALDRGHSVPGVVARVFIVNVVLVALAVVSVLWPGPIGATIALGCAAVSVGLLLRSFMRGKS
jgi:UDP-N-acetylmuramyl pentapeptide phosphotransferase/UDP-N-acetylglucosamine-1-phosphate transferase